MVRANARGPSPSAPRTFPSTETARPCRPSISHKQGRVCSVSQPSSPNYELELSANCSPCAKTALEKPVSRNPRRRRRRAPGTDQVRRASRRGWGAIARRGVVNRRLAACARPARHDATSASRADGGLAGGLVRALPRPRTRLGTGGPGRRGIRNRGHACRIAPAARLGYRLGRHAASFTSVVAPAGRPRRRRAQCHDVRRRWMGDQP